MNNFFLNQDPLLNNRPFDGQQPIIYQQIPQTQLRDAVGELDKTLKGLNQQTLDRLGRDRRFNELNGTFQSIVQRELLSLVKNRLNGDPNTVSNINELIKTIDEVKRGVESEKEESITEMNDYMKNYSHLTFDEYKRMKNGETLETKDKEKDKKKRCIL